MEDENLVQTSSDSCAPARRPTDELVGSMDCSFQEESGNLSNDPGGPREGLKPDTMALETPADSLRGTIEKRLFLDLHTENVPESSYGRSSDDQKISEDCPKITGNHEDLVELKVEDEDDRDIMETYGYVKGHSGTKNRTEHSINGTVGNHENIIGQAPTGSEHTETDRTIYRTDNSKNRKDSIYRKFTKNDENAENDEKFVYTRENIEAQMLLAQTGQASSRYATYTSGNGQAPTFQNDAIISESSNLMEEKTSESTKRAVSHEIDDFEVPASSRRRSLDYVPSSGAPSAKKAPNPRILLLDFADPKSSPFTNLKVVRNILISHTQIRSFNIKILERGGISILFNNPKAKAFAEKVLYEKLGDSLKRRGFLQNKSTFEVVTNLPNDVDKELLSKALSSTKSVKLGQNKVVFSLQTKEQAVELINDGFLFRNYQLEFKPFTFKPRIACKCGSIHHTSCSVDLFPSDLPVSTSAVCVNCRKTGHSPKECPLYIEKLKVATANKKKSYAAALGSKDGNSGGISPPSIFPKATHLVDPKLIADIVNAVLLHFKVDVNQGELENVISQCMQTSQPQMQSSQPHHPRYEQATVQGTRRKSGSSKYSSEVLAKDKQRMDKTFAQGSSGTQTSKNPSTGTQQTREKRTNQVVASKTKINTKTKQKSTPDQSTFPKCGCGHTYKAVSSWRKHWEKSKNPCASKLVTCRCGKMNLSPENYDASVNAFNEHSATCSKGLNLVNPQP